MLKDAAPNGVEVIKTNEIEEFSRIVSERYAPLRVNTDHRSRFTGAIKRQALGPLVASDVRATQHTVERAAALASRTPQGTYMLHVQLDGVGTIVQDGREAELKPGDMAFYDTDRAYSLSLDDSFRNAILVFPQSMLAIPRKTAAEFTATRIAGEHPVATMAVPFFTRLVESLGALPLHSGTRLAHSVIDLITTVVYAELGQHAPLAIAAQRNKSQLQEIQSYIEGRLGDPKLGPAQVAKDHFVSVRTLHSIFSREGVSVAEWIRARRLEHCHDDLANPQLRHVPIAAIVSRYGFTQAPHFSRLFKSVYGLSPSQFRANLLG